jgi:hypothetical protein
MKNFLRKRCFHILYVLFSITLILAIYSKNNITNELYKLMINYGFWYIFGILSGFHIFIWIYKQEK